MTGECAQRPGSVRTHQSVYAPTRECPHLISKGAETIGTNRGSMPSDLGVCAPTGEYPHLISEGTETTGIGERMNQGRPCTHTHSPEEAYHKKRVGRSWEPQDSSWKRKPTNKGITNR